MNKHILWIDLETTGLSPQKDFILEIACILTTQALDYVSFVHFVVQPQGIALEPLEQMMAKNVRAMHTENGLLEDIREGIDVTTAETAVLYWMKELDLGLDENPPSLGGSSVHFDRSFIQAHMPTLAAKLHYRNVDVSVLRRSLEMWGKTGWPEVKFTGDKHRALDDIKHSIKEAQLFKEMVASV